VDISISPLLGNTAQSLFCSSEVFYTLQYAGKQA